MAIRTRWGLAELVEVDLETGQVTSLTEPRPDIVVDSPRYSPDGTKIAYLHNDEEIGWRLMVRDARGTTDLDLPIGATPTMPTWDPSGEAVWVSFGQDLVGVPLDGTPEVRLSRKRGVLAPQISGDQVFFLTVYADGLALATAPLEDAQPLQIREIEPPPLLDAAEVTPGRYDPGLPWVTPLPSLGFDVRGWTTEVGLHASDRAGKYALLGWVGWGSDGVSPTGTDESDFTGVNVNLSTYFLPVRLQASGARLADQGEIVGVASFNAAYAERWENGAAEARLGLWLDDRRDGRAAGFADLAAGHTQWFGPVGATGSGQAHMTRTGGRSLLSARGTLGATAYGTRLTATFARSRSDLEDMTFQGRRTSMRPEGWGTWYVDAPGLVGSSLAGDHHRMLRADLAAEPVMAGLRYEKHTFWDTYGMGPTDVSMVSLVLSGSAPPIPMDIRPRLDVDLGFGCTVAGTEVTDTPCSKKEHYRMWLNGTWAARVE